MADGRRAASLLGSCFLACTACTGDDGGGNGASTNDTTSADGGASGTETTEDGGDGSDSGGTGETSTGSTDTTGGETSTDTAGTTGTGTSDTSATDTTSGGTSGTGSDTSSSGTTGGGTDTTSTDTTSGGAVDECGDAEHQLMPPGSPWNTSIAGAALDPESDAIISYLQSNVTSDFSITVLEADDGVIHQPFAPTADWFGPDCDTAPVPIPPGGHIEGESGYACEDDGDCHLIVIDRDECRLFEMWRADYAGPGAFDGGCLAVWSMDMLYPDTLRGDYCTSADAAGLPIAALLFSADEIAAGEIPHAIRFIVPNANIRADTYVRPGTHSTPATSGGADAPPYSARLRLRQNVDISGLSPAAQVVARAMKEYGMILADAGNITFTARSDDFTSNTWASVGLGPHDLKALDWDDFEVVDGGARITWSDGDCNRTIIEE